MTVVCLLRSATSICHVEAVVDEGSSGGGIAVEGVRLFGLKDKQANDCHRKECDAGWSSSSRWRKVGRAGGDAQPTWNLDSVEFVLSITPRAKVLGV